MCLSLSLIAFCSSYCCCCSFIWWSVFLVPSFLPFFLPLFLSVFLSSFLPFLLACYAIANPHQLYSRSYIQRVPHPCLLVPVSARKHSSAVMRCIGHRQRHGRRLPRNPQRQRCHPTPQRRRRQQPLRHDPGPTSHTARRRSPSCARGQPVPRAPRTALARLPRHKHHFATGRLRSPAGAQRGQKSSTTSPSPPCRTPGARTRTSKARTDFRRTVTGVRRGRPMCLPSTGRWWTGVEITDN